MIRPSSLVATWGLLALSGCQPPVVQAHIDPHSERCQPSDSGLDDKSGTLTVTGTATLEVTPNVADVTLDLTATAANPRHAVAKLRSREEAMRTNLAEEGMATQDIAVSTLTLSPTSRWDAARQRQIPTGYEARLRVTVATEDFSQIPAVVEAGANAGVTTSTTTFRNTEMSELKRKVRDMALDAAKAKARQFQGALELEGMRVVAVSEAPSGMAWSAYGLGFDNAIVTANVAGVAGPSGGAVQAQALPLQLTVTIGYALG
ncbi:MAG: SIMPL domain-containing protein [Nannocystales bacterium]